MERHTFSWIEKLNIVNISILLKLFYRVSGIPVKILKVLLWNMKRWKVDFKNYIEEKSGKESQDSPREE